MHILIYGGITDLPDLTDWDVEMDPASSWKSWRKAWLKIYVTAITAIGFKVATAEIYLQMWVFIGSMLGNRVYISWYSFVLPFSKTYPSRLLAVILPAHEQTLVQCVIRYGKDRIAPTFLSVLHNASLPETLDPTSQNELMLTHYTNSPTIWLIGWGWRIRQRTRAS